MAVTTEDIAEAVKQLWAAATTLSNPTTGLVKSIIMGRVPDPAANAVASPYTSFKVTDGLTQRIATNGYLQTFTVEFKTWDETGAADLGPIKVAIEAAFTKNTRTALTLASTRALAILHSVKMPGALEEDEATKNNKSVKVTTDRFEILCQG